MKYSIRLPFYLFTDDDHTSEKSVNIYFNNKEITKNFIVQSRDRLNTDDFMFDVDVEPGFYNLEIVPNTSTTNASFIALDDIYLNNNKFWANVLNFHSHIEGQVKNSDGSKILQKLDPEDSPNYYGFQYMSPAKFWWDTSLEFRIELPDNDQWKDRYRYGTWDIFLFRYNRIKTMPRDELVSKVKYGTVDQWIKSLDTFYTNTSPKYEQKE